MSLKNTVTLHAVFWLYMILGGGIFYIIENPAHNVNHPANGSSIGDNLLCSDLLQSVNRTLGDQRDIDQVLELVLQTCLNLTSPEEIPQSHSSWDFTDALFLSMTILTTIGYGNLVPITNGGKLFCIAYGFLGIPLAGMLLASTSDYFSNHLLLLYSRQRSRRHNEKAAIAIATFVYLIPGLLLFLFIPAGIFTVIEGWTYLDGLYFSFATLTTTGFGDLVATQNTNAPWLWIYRIAAICWIIIGIGYWAMIIAFVTKAFKSKELRRKWERTTTAIVHQAEELRKSLEQSVRHQQDKFLPRKSKAAFDFALQMSGCIAQLDPELERQLKIPGVAAALKQGTRVSALFGLPGVLAGVGRSEKPETTPRPDGKRAFQNARTMSEDSGVNVEQDVELAASKKFGSCSSLPVTISESCEKRARRAPLRRSETRPELLEHSVDNSSHETLKELLMEAMSILEEAEARGQNVNTL